MPETTNRTADRIVVGVDGSAPANAALRWAVGQAELTGDAVLAIIAWQYPISRAGFGWAPVPLADGTDLESAAEKVLAQAVDEVVERGCNVAIEQRVVEGYPPSVLVHATAHAKMLVVGSPGHGTFAEVLLGSVSQNCAHHAKCPVVIVRK